MKNQESRGKARKVEGRVEQAIGIVTGDGTLERQGARKRAAGAVGEGLGKAQRKVDELLHGVPKATED